MKNLMYASGFVIGILFSGCGRNSSEKNHITVEKNQKEFHFDTRLQNLQKPAEKLIVSAELGGHINTSDGATILVAPGTFVLDDGTEIKGDVNLSYRALNTPAEIIASGIPMQADNKGEIGQFISDGMFELNAAYQGKKVSIVKGKDIQVYTPVRDKESDFQYWYFNPSTKNWEAIGTRDKLAKDETIQDQEKELGIAKTISWNSYTAHQSIFRLASVFQSDPDRTIPGKYDPNKATLDINFDPKVYPELAEYSRIMWQYAGTDPEKDPENNRWLFQSSWTRVNLSPHPTRKMVFKLNIQAGLKSFETEVRPVVTGKDLERAQALYAQEQANPINEPVKERPLASAQTIQNNMYNVFRVAKLGFYNCDRFYNDQRAFTYNPDYNYYGADLNENQTLYFLINNKTGMIQFSANHYKLTVNPEIVDAIFTVAENGAIAAVTAVSLNQMKNQQGGKLSFNFEKVKTKITGMKSLLEAIAGI